MIKIFWLACAALMVGCATTARQSEEIFKSPPAVPRQSQVANVLFVNQSEGYCGPATLAMAMRWAGSSISMEELAPQVYTPGMKGTLQQDLISAGRRNGFMAVPISGLSNLLREVAAGHPVIIFENLGLSWLPRWHYAVVHGYDLDRREVIMHSGPEAFKHWDMSVFERSWEYADHWGLVILPPGKLSAAGDELAHMTSAAGLEQAGKVNEADKSYMSILARWPKSLGALIGLANTAYKRGDRKNAVKFLRLATTYHPESKAAQHNLALALKMR